MKYYSLKRPILPGGYPKGHGGTTVVNFMEPEFCKEVGTEAYGYVEYSSPIPEKEADEHELVPEGSRIYWRVTISVGKDGKRSAMISKTIRDTKQPEDDMKSLSRKQVAHRWFPSRDKADRFIKDFLKEEIHEKYSQLS